MNSETTYPFCFIPYSFFSKIFFRPGRQLEPEREVKGTIYVLQEVQTAANFLFYLCYKNIVINHILLKMVKKNTCKPMADIVLKGEIIEP